MTAANGNGVINRGTNYSDGDQVTSANLNEHVDNAEFNTSAVDDTTIGLNSASPKALFVKNGGINTTQLANGSVSAGKLQNQSVTKSKIEHISDKTILGNLSGSTGAVEEISVLDEDTLSSDSATALATQQSIKAFAESLIPKYINITSNSSLNIAQTDTSTTTHTYPIANFAGGAGLDTAKIRGFFVEITAKARRISSTTSADVKVTMPDGTDVVLLGHQAENPEDNQNIVKGTVFAPVNSGQTNFVLKPTLSGNTKETTLTIRGCLQYGL